MKSVWLLAALALLLPLLPAGAGESGHPRDVLVVDKDPGGTNVRETPAGRVVRVIPFKGGNSPRLVRITGQAGGWFTVALGDTTGWVHGSVLGTCATATEDGAPALCRSPRNDSPCVDRLPAGAPVRVLDMHGAWLRVRFVDAKGESHDGWLSEQAVSMGENGQARCARAWAHR